jgi:SAM-dependent methyltransferase
MEDRTNEELLQHYQVEVELADRLRGAHKDERRKLYASVYDELFQRVPSHPQLRRKASAEDSAKRVSAQMKLLKPFLQSDTVFMEVGPGDCQLALAVAPLVRRVYAIDVSRCITGADHLPPNMDLVLSDGVSVPVQPKTISLAYSNQVLEHLHPEDALEQLRDIHAALAPGGVYLCITPNRLSGPHDISGYFSSVPKGLHLREYANYEVFRIFRKAGFSHVVPYPRGKRSHQKFGLAICEVFLGLIPSKRRRHLIRRFHLSYFSSVVALGAK